MGYLDFLTRCSGQDVALKRYVAAVMTELQNMLPERKYRGFYSSLRLSLNHLVLLTAMEENAQQCTEKYISARSQHPTWILLASRRAPLVLGCLRAMFKTSHDGIPMEDALQALAGILSAHASQELYEIEPDNTHLQAGRELREWIKRRLVVEREGRILQRMHWKSRYSLLNRWILLNGNPSATVPASRLFQFPFDGVCAPL